MHKFGSAIILAQASSSFQKTALQVDPSTSNNRGLQLAIRRKYIDVIMGTESCVEVATDFLKQIGSFSPSNE